MAEEGLYSPYIFQEDSIDPSWIGMDPHLSFPMMAHNDSMRIADGPYLQITEQPKQRGFRFRYGCEGPSHGGLPGASSEKNKKTYPQVRICNYQGPARLVVQLVTNTQEPHLHAHSLVGKQCDKGICIADLPAKDSIISFPNLGILHVTKKNVSKTLEERMTEAYRMGYNNGVVIHPEIDACQGEGRFPRELKDHQRHLIASAAHSQSKEMDLSVVRLMFTAFLPDSDGGYTRRLDAVISEPIYDSKAPNASNLKIVRMDRTAGCVTGGEEVYLLCDKVQKDDIQVRFYEEDDNGVTWEAFGDFSPTDVHRQFAIVFKTPKYRDQNLQKPISVCVQLKRKSDNETSEPKPFTYHPQIIDKEEVQRKRQKTLPNFPDCGGAGGGGSMYRGGGGGSTMGGGPGTGGPGQYFAGYSNYQNAGSNYTFALDVGGGATNIMHASSQTPMDDSDADKDDPLSGGVAQITTKLQSHVLGDTRKEREGSVEHGSGRTDIESLLESRLVALAERQAHALFQYSLSGDVRALLAPQRPLMTAQDDNGDTGLHLSVIHSRTDSVTTLTQVISALPGEDVVNMRNDLYQTPLHLAVVTQQKSVVDALMMGGADPGLTDRHGNTALHLAAQQREGDMVAQLLRHGCVAELADVPNSAGLCALHLAVLANSLSSVRALLEGGANVEVRELTCGRAPLHLAVENNNISLSGCLLLEGNADVDSCTYNGCTPLHIAAGRGSAKMSALLMAAGADPHKENYEPLYFREDECIAAEEEEDEGFIPGTTPLDMAASSEVREILCGKEYQPDYSPLPVPARGDLRTLAPETKQSLCQALEERDGGWESLAHTLGLGVLATAFRLSPSPAVTLLDSYEVSGGTVRELLEGLKQVGNRSALSLLQDFVPPEKNPAPQSHTKPSDLELLTCLHEEGTTCDSGVETSLQRPSLSLTDGLCGQLALPERSASAVL
ncbi:nuclear factor NF-kappa-B p105 subunit [Denticeps clupeoides]|uniref:RHD domain-containing protein n=1 Tax=Denticeps clupeoides TaxID=299321 RepID=A0AAY4E1N5_9TELE|nr:nuclear factor NF-kappa-B p105 subunit [Denticeps clupeoides]